MSNLHTQLALGGLGNTFYGIWWALVFVGLIPCLIWLVISLILFFKKKSGWLTWWGITVGACLTYGLFTFGYGKVFCGAPYRIAQRIHVYVPMTVQVLENDQLGSRDEAEEYEVVRFNPSQMNDFIQEINGKWKYGTIVPDALRHPNRNLSSDPMSDRKYPLPKAKRVGYYASYIKKRYEPGDWYTTRKAYFLDVKTRRLYVYYDDAQWG
ncbi:MAG: hypothetical protein K6T83_18125 [Alicyclobacillus sp.]|nr:hypothetical protein [Alicyclobacillus sp.]